MAKAEPPRSVLVVLMGALGDVTRALALINPIAEAFPGVRITWFVESKCRAMVELHPRIDRIVEFERRHGVKGFFRSLRELRAERYDLALDLQRHAKSGLVSLLSGAARRIGFHRSDAKEGNWLFSNQQIAKRGEGGAKLDHYFEFLTALGVARPQKVSFGLEEAARRECAIRPNGVRYVVAVLGSSWKSKNWPYQGYDQACRLILQQSAFSVVLVGDRSQAQVAEQLIADYPDGRIINRVGATSIPELVGLLGGAEAAFGPDSGPGHIASALGVRYVGLFGPTSPDRVAFFGNRERALQAAIPCSGCYRRRCPGLDMLCMRLIDPAVVVRALEL